MLDEHEGTGPWNDDEYGLPWIPMFAQYAGNPRPASIYVVA